MHLLFIYLFTVCACVYYVCLVCFEFGMCVPGLVWILLSLVDIRLITILLQLLCHYKLFILCLLANYTIIDMILNFLLTECIDGHDSTKFNHWDSISNALRQDFE